MELILTTKRIMRSFVILLVCLGKTFKNWYILCRFFKSPIYFYYMFLYFSLTIQNLREQKKNFLLSLYLLFSSLNIVIKWFVSCLRVPRLRDGDSATPKSLCSAFPCLSESFPWRCPDALLCVFFFWARKLHFAKIKWVLHSKRL